VAALGAAIGSMKPIWELASGVLEHRSGQASLDHQIEQRLKIFAPSFEEQDKTRYLRLVKGLLRPESGQKTLCELIDDLRERSVLDGAELGQAAEACSKIAVRVTNADVYGFSGWDVLETKGDVYFPFNLRRWHYPFSDGKPGVGMPLSFLSGYIDFPDQTVEDDRPAETKAVLEASNSYIASELRQPAGNNSPAQATYVTTSHLLKSMVVDDKDGDESIRRLMSRLARHSSEISTVAVAAIRSVDGKRELAYIAVETRSPYACRRLTVPIEPRDQKTVESEILKEKADRDLEEAKAAASASGDGPRLVTHFEGSFVPRRKALKAKMTNCQFSLLSGNPGLFDAK
jgi:hypothetical protein